MADSSEQSTNKHKSRGLHERFVGVLRVVTPERIRRNYTAKLAVGFVTIIILSIIVGGVITLQTEAAIENDTNEQLRTTAMSQSESLEQWVSRTKEQTRLLSQARIMRGHHNDSARTRINHFLAHEVEEDRLPEEVTGLHMIDSTNAEILASAHEDDVGRQLSHSGLGIESMSFESADETTITDPFRHNETDNATIAVVSPVPSDDPTTGEGDHQHDAGSGTGAEGGEHEHWLVMLVDLEQRADGFAGDTDQFTLVVNSNGQIILGPQKDRILSQHKQDSTGVDSMAVERGLGGATGTSRMNMQIGGTDRSYLAGYAPVESDDVEWVAVSHVSTGAAFQLRDSIIQNLIILILLGVIGFGGVWAAIQLDARRLERLTGKADEMSDGNLDVEIPDLERTDEIGSLYRTFDGMRIALKQKIEETEQAQREAEAQRAKAVKMSNHLKRRAETYSETMQHCAAGDLTQRMERDEQNEAMDRIAAEFNQMIEELEKTIGQLKSYIEEVEEAGAEVEQSAGTVREASEQVADSIQTIAVDAKTQKDRLEEIAEMVDEMADDLETFASEQDVDFDAQLEEIREMTDEIDEIVELSEGTQSETDTVSAAAQEQAAELNEVSQRAGDLQRYAQPLRDILQRFETEAEHEFVFSVGPTGSPSPTRTHDTDDD